ncbi:tryptophan 7-halogenase [Sphingomonas piscis]|uniref:Tryptophan 7-halogenase n=1 Tax=Sphingomonas piscis TaxID=2714943 RepID=A0A6G7YMS7_9SPHN|nr:tryptophan halogenase family protein [Sphingomonas piscis]QIK78049.1 tryptophan 7-halogenase [Sphingomonas piscis]
MVAVQGTDKQGPIESICIVGGGTAGWMTAAALCSKLQGLPVSIRLVESEEIGTVGVGEATLPHIRAFNNSLGISERELMQTTEATFKLGIEFCDWGKIGDRYIHPFGDYGPAIEGVPFYHYWLKLRSEGVNGAGRLDDYSYGVSAAEHYRFRYPAKDPAAVESTFGYAYQFDASLYAKFLRRFSEQRGILRTEGKIASTALDPNTGFVQSVTLESGEAIEADLFIDCSGFRGLLIEQALQTGYDDWSRWLPCNRAIALPTESRGAIGPFTRATARQSGWQWRIPLQHRVGNGHVYCSDFISDEEAERVLLDNLDAPALKGPNRLRFTTGRRKLLWNKNVVAVGLSGGFLEPLESTSIHLIQDGITELIQIFPDKSFNQDDIDEYNRRMELHFERVRDFLLLHYVATQRDDSDFWRHFRSMTLPDSLQEKISAWTERGTIIAYEHGLFLPPSWIAVMMGQNLMPRGYDRRADALPTDVIARNAAAIRANVAAAVAATPTHEDFIRKSGVAATLGNVDATAV